MVSALSFVSGGTVRSLLYQTVGDALRSAAERWPEREAQHSGWRARQLSGAAAARVSGAPGKSASSRVAIVGELCDSGAAVSVEELWHDRDQSREFQSDVNDPIKRRVTTAGRVHPHVQVKIVDAQGKVI